MKQHYKILIVFLGLIVISVTIICSRWVLKSELKNSVPAENTETAPQESTAGTTRVITQTDNPQSTASSPDTETLFEKSRKKLLDASKIVEISTFKDRNDLLYITREQSSASLFAANINDQDKISQAKLLDNTSVEKDMQGIWNISTGNTFGNFIYMSDSPKPKSIVFYDTASLTKNDNILPEAGALQARPLLSGLDNRVVYAKPDSGNKAINVVSSSFDMKDIRNVFTITLQDEAQADSLGWLDMSADEKSILFTLKDNPTGNYVLWSADILSGELKKLTDSDSSVLSAKWSRDGRKIVYAKKESAGISNISVYDFDKKENIRITNSKSKSYSPDWSFYGDKIVYVSDENGIGGLYLIDYI